ncbi:MAG: YraN family protein [Clostridiales bacterium]|nr:YraN family protein [Clostridiales bacterium]
MGNKRIGMIGEEAAAMFLEENGYRLVRRNYRCKVGEIDIIASKGSVLCFAEVKTRQNFNYGRPCESITEEKKKHMRKAAQSYLDEVRIGGFRPAKIRFDVIEIVVEHTRGAF